MFMMEKWVKENPYRGEYGMLKADLVLLDLFRSIPMTGRGAES
jgi:hypothetical protein